MIVTSPFITPYIEMNSKCSLELNVRAETIGLLEEIIDFKSS
jgi:hypothetical protein